MNKMQENKFSMYIVVNNFCDANKKSWVELKAFADAKVKFAGIIDKIEQTRQVQELNRTGITIERKKNRVELTEMTLKYINAMKIYSDLHGNSVLQKEIDYNKTALNISRDTIFVDICRLILKRAKKYKDQLTDFGPTPEMINTFEDLFKTYVKNLGSTRIERNQKILSTSELAEAFVEGDHLLRTYLDGMMIFFKENDVVFYNNYMKARKIVSRGNRNKITEIEVNQEQAA